MFDSLHRIVCALSCAAVALLLGFCVWQMGLLPVVVGLAVVAFLTTRRLWLAALFGLFLGLH